MPKGEEHWQEAETSEFSAERFEGVIKLPSGQGQCLKCGKVFFNPSTTYRHYRTKHAPAKKLSCPVCQKVLTNRVYLQNHLRMVHNIRQSNLKNAKVPQEMRDDARGNM